MPKVSPIQGNFSAGEWGPLTQGRVDADLYKAAMGTSINYLPPTQGGLIRRPGTEYIYEVKDSSKKTRLVPFRFSTTQAYMLEFGENYIRVYKDEGVVLSGGVPYEIVTTYTEDEIFDLRFTQSADTLYIAHPNHFPATLTRTGHTAWTLFEPNLYVYNLSDYTSKTDGPWINPPAYDTTITVTISGAGPSYTYRIVASAPTFSANDVGRLVRWFTSSKWSSAQITSFVSPTTVDCLVKGNARPVGATLSAWRLGLWYAGNYPSSVCFHEDRLVFFGVPSNPARVDLSKTGDYMNFGPSELDGTVTASDALSVSINASEVNAGKWIVSDEKGLLLGSIGAEWVMKPAGASEALSATNVSAKKATSLGSAGVTPVQVGKATMFVQKSGRKLREFIYFYDVDGFQSNDLTRLANHVTQSGIKEMAYTSEPYPVLWCVRNDGVLAAMSYERDSESLKVGWSRHILGGTSDAAGTAAAVQSVAVIPSLDGSFDQLWMIVKRYVNGSVKQYVEILSQFFDDTMTQEESFHVDCGVTYDDPKTITGITKANPAVITSNAHGFSNGDKVKLSEIAGMTEFNDVEITIANVTANTYEAQGVDSTGYTTYISGGVGRKYVSTISGLTWLEGETVAVWADGAVQKSQVVTAGAITLAQRATIVTIGYGYRSQGQLLRIEAGAADGTALGKTRRTHRCGFLVYRTLGLEAGTNFDQLDVLRTGQPASLGAALPLYSGILSEVIEATYDMENQICFAQEIPAPGMILAVMPRMVTQDA